MGDQEENLEGSKVLDKETPLSLFLFTLVADGLSRMVEKATKERWITGCLVDRDNVVVSHLQFADHMLFFMDAEKNSFINLLKVLGIFCLVSSLKVILEKSMLLGIGMDEGFVSELASMVGCEVGEWPTKYLGMPLGGNPHYAGFWDPVVDKVAKRLNVWKMAFLSKGDRLLLIESVLSAIPTYYLTLFSIPIGITKVLEKLMRDFLWKLQTSVVIELVTWLICFYFSFFKK
ncbi:hypothetical protein TorRG33x02_145500 [Trema orientale]|uniref:Reverse transcriptase domain-containing protein n=1 Tax=Trema orientale TaxID=63057 RepID=A0A2P5EVZ3_TREOI|nr:hypothetical protein TorRG33x02_145500 [Trema orientale]